mgnify:CR=1 FL=1
MPATASAPGSVDALTIDQAFELLPADFNRVRELIHARAGISLHAGKQAMVYSRLSRRLRDTGHASFTAYLQWLQAQHADDAEWQEFTNCLTTNLTSFFREAHHFDALVDDLRADSLDIVDLTIAIEEAFSEDAEFEIRDEDAENIHTVQDILDFLAGQGLS